MRVLLFGASGMVGQGVLRECLLAADVSDILAVSRGPLRLPLPDAAGKLSQLQHVDFLDFEPVAGSLAGFDACFFCLGVSVVGLKQEEYERITYGYTLAAAGVLARVNPGMVFVYVSGEGTDSTERGGSMWARVKGRTENALRALPFRAVYLFRPGFIQPLHGIRSKTGWYQGLYAVLAPLYPVLHRVARAHMTTTEEVGRAMLQVVRSGAPQPILSNREIARLAAVR